jgi:ankyrin repeat protein
VLLARPDIQINARNQMGWSALTKASFIGHVISCDGFSRGPTPTSTPSITTARRRSFHAVPNEQLDVVRLLLSDPRIDRAIANRRGHTALDQANAVGFTAIAELIR